MTTKIPQAKKLIQYAQLQVEVEEILAEVPVKHRPLVLQLVTAAYKAGSASKVGRTAHEPKAMTLRRAMVKVMGKEALTGSQVYARLMKLGHEVKSVSPKSYITHRLCRHKETFERVPGKRALYRVKKNPKV